MMLSSLYLAPPEEGWQPEGFSTGKAEEHKALIFPS